MENYQGVRHFIALWLLCFLMSWCIRSEVSAQTATNKVIFLDSIRHHLEPQPLPPLDSLSITPDLPVTPYPDNSLLDSLRRLHSGYWGGSYTPQSILPQKLEKSDNVGTPHGVLSISPLGAAVYDVDIKVPDGGKLTPTIGLRYNSQMSGYGLVGYGTELTGFSSITRGMRNLFLNGIQKGLAYSPNDNLYLDGKRLILESGEAGKEGAIYVLEGDPYTRVTEHGDYRHRGTSTWFEVRTKDGTTYEYGHANMARITYLIHHGSRGVIAWYVNKVSDRYDNYMIYTYSVDRYSIRPNMIWYGMNSRTGKEGDYRIIFKYGTLDANKRTFRVKQYQGERDFCLSNITTYVKNAINRSYDLTYSHDLDKSYGKWTRLTSVIEKNSKGEALRPISLQWAGLPNLVPQVHQLDVSMDDSGAWIKSSGEKSLFAVDVTGDGISDIMRIVPVTTITSVSSNSVTESYYTYLFVNRSKISSDGQISYEAPLIYTLPPSLSDKTHSVLFNGYSVMDFDGDGYNDILIPFEEDFAHAASRTKFYFILGADIVAGKQKTSFYTILPKPNVDVNPLYTTFDVDGNGKDDLMYVVKGDEGEKYWCCLVRNEGGDYSSASSFQLQLSDKPQRLFSADYNNDGLTDMLFLCQNGYKIFFNKGGKASDVHFSDDKSFVGNDLSNFWRIEQGDFDGDGLLDFVYNKTHERILYVAFNLGSGIFKHVPTGDLGLADHNSGKDDDRFAIRVVDIDHDGRSDVMVCKAGYVYRGFPKFKNKYTDTQVRWLYSDGTQLNIVSGSNTFREDDAKEKTIFIGDFDGDGFMEVANHGGRLDQTNDTFNGKINVYSINSRKEDGKIIAIQDGMGTVHRISYATTTQPSVYQQTNKGNYPVNTYTLPISLVASITEQNAPLGSIRKTYYTYKDLKVNLQGKGLLGFETIENENKLLGTHERTHIKKWNQKYWIPEEIEVTKKLGSGQSYEFSKSETENMGKTFFSYVAERKITDYDGNKTSIKTSYDTNKGVVIDEEVRLEGVDMYKKVSYADYIHTKGGWLPCTLKKEQKHKDDANISSSVTNYQYDDIGNVVKIEENSDSDMPLLSLLSYDAYGNIISNQKSGKGISPIIHYYDYDDSGQLLVKEYTSPQTEIHTFTYDKWGNCLTENNVTDANNILTVRHEYTDWDKRKATYFPDGTQQRWETGWVNDNKGLYYVREIATNRADKIQCIDGEGKEVYSATLGPRNVDISTSTTYNQKGEVTHIERKIGKLLLTEDLSYDDRGRMISKTSSSGRNSTFSYGNRSVTETTSGKSVTREIDAWGNAIKIIEPMGDVSFEYGSNGKPVRTTAHGVVVSMDYDKNGNQILLSDPDAGTSSYTYGADGRLLEQTDARKIKTVNTYDELGRLSKKSIGGRTTTYTYGTSGNERNKLIREQLDDKSIAYRYDRFGRIIEEKRTLGQAGHRTFNQSFVFTYQYNAQGQLEKVTYPGDVSVTYHYDTNGFKTQALLGDSLSLYSLTDYDGQNTYTSSIGSLVVGRYRDENGYEKQSEVRVRKRNRWGFDEFEACDDILEAYDGITGNLRTRQRMGMKEEKFSYDALDRLTSVRTGKDEVRIDYLPNGNIDYKTGVGYYSYNKAHPHAVEEVDNDNGQIFGDKVLSLYNEMGKISMLENTERYVRLHFEYGPDQQRWFTEYLGEGAINANTIYMGPYEHQETEGRKRDVYYLDGNTIAIKEDGKLSTYLALTDNLGSILSVIDKDGRKVFDASYDAWGKQTIRYDSLGITRGYTSHEMLDIFDVINMNGRLYDPQLGRFFSPDNYVQMPENSQSYNRYSYCLNNPLKYTDPSGELWGIDDAFIAMALFGMANSMIQAGANGENIWKAGGMSLLGSVVTYGIGSAFGPVGSVGNELLRAGAHGVAGGLMGALEGKNFFSSFVISVGSSGIGSFAKGVKLDGSLMVVSTAAMGGALAWATGGDFLKGAMQGMMIGAFNHLLHDDGIHYFKDRQGNQNGLIPEVVVTAPGPDWFVALSGAQVLSNINTSIDAIGNSLKENSGNSTYGSNGHFYWHTDKTRGFYGNQYVRTTRLTDVGKGILKYTRYSNTFFTSINLGSGFYLDYLSYDLNGTSNGYNTVKAAAQTLGGWAGFKGGALLGAEFGGAIGGYFGGIGAIPGGIIGGAIGGILGSFGGEWVGGNLIDYIYEK